ncbi:putative heme degradation protein [Ochrobactrum sp. BH3]|nr:putative heme degradation protein [Ochrobactrum sp. BH3]
MSEQLTRAKLLADPADVLKTLPTMGKLMINSKSGGATHERIGVVEQVEVRDGWVHFSGAEHNSRIDLNAIASLIVDRSSVMQEKVYPRIDLLASDDSVIGSVIGFEGAEPFDKALDSFEFATLEPKAKEQGGMDKQEVGEDDPGLAPFAAAQRNKAEIRIALELPAFKQEWSGEMPEVRPSRGFINVMKPDFHLHLKAGHVASWREVGTDDAFTFYALNEEGEETGLNVSGNKNAFQ